MLLSFWRYYLRCLSILLIKLVIVIGCLYFVLSILGCGEDTTDNYYGKSCEAICDTHCNTCWSWGSDILRCKTRCTSDCNAHGCDYIDVPSTTCDEVFQDVCY